MSDSSEIDAALVNRLQTDPALKALMPDGVFMDTAPPGAKRFVLCGLMDSDDRATFGGRALERVMYFAKAVALSSAGANMKAAAAQIDLLLTEATFPVTGFSFIACYRDEDRPRLRYEVPDTVDPSLRWFHRGGHYVIEVERIRP